VQGELRKNTCGVEACFNDGFIGRVCAECEDGGKAGYGVCVARHSLCGNQVATQQYWSSSIVIVRL
jgi:hypothetical protein